MDFGGQSQTTTNDLDDKVQRIENIIEKLRKIEKDRDDTFRDLKEKVRLNSYMYTFSFFSIQNLWAGKSMA